MSAPLISIVMPLYNAGPFVGEAVASVNSQTFSDWELIVVDDASHDASADIMAGLAAEESRIRLLRQPRNLGAAAARNAATAQAQGRWIAFLDADDLWEPEKLARLLRFAETNGHAFVHHWYRRMAADGTPRGGTVTAPPRMTYADLLRTNRVGCLTAMYDTSRAGKFYAPNIARRNDYATWLSLLRRVGEVHCLPEALAWYRLSPGSLSRRKLGLLPDHYRLFRQIEGLSMPTSAFYVCCNVVGKLARG